MRTSLNRKINLVFLGILVIGIIFGVLFLMLSSESSKEIIFLNINNYLQNITPINNILYHIISLSCLLICSFLLIGIPFSLFFLFYNGFSIGFIIACLTHIFNIKGLLYGIIYVLITKGVFIIFLIIFIKSLLKISGVIIDKMINKVNIKERMYYLIIRCIVIIGIILLSDIILYFLGVTILNIFNFLLI